MKKGNLTLERKMGVIGLGLLVFFVFCCSQEALAQNITMNVKSKTNANANKHWYIDPVSGKAVADTLSWKEKAAYNGGEVGITVKSAKAGYLVIKADFVSLTYADPDELPTGRTIASYFLKYASSAGPFPSKDTILVTENDVLADGTVVHKSDLSTLVLDSHEVAANTTVTLFNFFDTSFTRSLMYITFTAVVVDTIDPLEDPQVMGVDSQTIFFNGQTVPASGATTLPNNSSIWLQLLQEGRAGTLP